MVTAAVEQNIDWVSPPPLWGEQIDFTQDPARLAFRSPAVLRFATDAFMEEFLASVDTAPDRLRQLVARPEVWPSPLAGPPAANSGWPGSSSGSGWRPKPSRQKPTVPPMGRPPVWR